MFLAAADWFEILAALVFLIVSGLAQFIQKRSQERKGAPVEPPVETTEEGAWGGQPPPVAPTPEPVERRATPAEDLGETLRRLLGESVVPPPPPPRLPPRPSPLAPPPPIEVEETESWEEQPAPTRALSHIEETVNARLGSFHVEPAPDPQALAARLQESTATRVRAHTAAATPDTVHYRPTAPDAKAVLALLRSPRTARQAMVASVILSPPRAFD